MQQMRQREGGGWFTGWLTQVDGYMQVGFLVSALKPGGECLGSVVLGRKTNDGSISVSLLVLLPMTGMAGVERRMLEIYRGHFRSCPCEDTGQAEA